MHPGLRVGLVLACQLAACAEPTLETLEERQPAGIAGRQDLPGPPVISRPPQHPRLCDALSRLLAAAEPQRAALARSLGVEREPGARRVLVQLDLASGRRPGEIDDELLARLGARARQRGTDRLDVWAPVDALPVLAAASGAIARLRLPQRPHASLGNVVTQGVKLSAADAFHCRKAMGQGVHVAVVDLGFGSFQAAGAELGSVVGPPPPGGSVHGTACAEILFDMAPDIALHPVAVASLADLQAFVAKLPGSGIQLVASSLVWTGEAFADGTGAHCAAADQARQAGALWVNSVGNHGAGTFYLGAFTDVDGDGLHEFGPGDELNDFSLGAKQTVNVVLDWDAYPTTDQDYDLHLHQLVSGAWQVVKSSTDVQSGSQPPNEALLHTAATAGTYGVSIERRKGSTPSVPLRLFVLPAPGIVLQHSQKERSLEGPGHCKSVITVGAVEQASYASGQIWPASSQGPTKDGRIKPDLVAPGGVASFVYGEFSGTSAAAPHVAGALALYMQATGKGPVAASDLLLGDATPTGTPVPNNVFGRGRLALQPGRCGWACAAGVSGPCPTLCGSAGQGTCGADCAWASCRPPAETCNGKDDDCDGASDNGFACAAGSTASCRTACGSTGQRRCGVDCTWSTCQPPAETCNGRDDDCDGLTDEGCPSRPGEGCGCDVARGAQGPATAGLLLPLLLGLWRARRRWARDARVEQPRATGV